MSVVTLTTVNFKQAITDNAFVIVDFWASWCPPCRTFAPTFETVSAEFPNVVFGKVCTEEEKSLSDEFAIRSIPTLMIFRDGIKVYSESGARPAESLRELLGKAGALDMDAVRETGSADSETFASPPPIPDQFGALHALTCLYITFAYVTDDFLSPEELGTIVTKIGEWDADADAKQISAECIEWLNSMDNNQKRSACAAISQYLVGEDSPFSKTHLKAVIKDMVQVAMADGDFSSEEVDWIEAQRKVFGLELHEVLS